MEADFLVSNNKCHLEFQFKFVDNQRGLSENCYNLKKTFAFMPNRLSGFVRKCQNNPTNNSGTLTKGQIISKAILKFSFEPKIDRKYYSISALGL